MTKKLLFLLWIFCVAGSASAQQDCLEPIEPTTLFYVNGVNNSLDQAEASAAKLADALLIDRQLGTSCLEVRNAYNKSEPGLFLDLIEAALQFLDDEASTLVRWLAGREAIPSVFEGQFLLYLGFSDPVEYVVDRDLNRMVSDVESALDEARDVVLVSHSQGNFYSNRVHARVSATRSISIPIVAASTPASLIAGYPAPYGYPSTAGDPDDPETRTDFYVRLEDDYVANFLFPPAALEANLDNGSFFSCGDRLSDSLTLCHSFSRVYLADGSASRLRILQRVDESLRHSLDSDLFSDDFENDSVGSFPSAWVRAFSGAGIAAQGVVLDPVNAGNQMLRLVGSSTGTNAAGAAALVEFPDRFAVEMDILNGTEPFGAGHQERAYIYLRTTPTGSSRTLIGFRGSNVVIGQESVVLQSYSPGVRYNVRIEYERFGQQATMSYWIDGVSLGSIVGRALSYESSLAYLHLTAQGGSVLFDNVEVTEF